MTLQQIFITNLKKIRKEQGLSQMILSEKCDTTSNYIGQIEMGRRIPSFDKIEQIAAALDISPHELFACNSEDTEDKKEREREQNIKEMKELISRLSILTEKMSHDNDSLSLSISMDTTQRQRDSSTNHVWQQAFFVRAGKVPPSGSVRHRKAVFVSDGSRGPLVREEKNAKESGQSLKIIDSSTGMTLFEEDGSFYKFRPNNRSFSTNNKNTKHHSRKTVMERQKQSSGSVEDIAAVLNVSREELLSVTAKTKKIKKEDNREAKNLQKE